MKYFKLIQQNDSSKKDSSKNEVQTKKDFVGP